MEVKPALLYGFKCAPIKRSQIEMFLVAEMRMT